MRIIDLHPEEDREEVQRNFSTLLEVGHVETERRMKKRDGQLIWVSWRIVMTSDQFSLGYCQDITERKEAEEIRSQMEAQLRQAQKMEALGRWREASPMISTTFSGSSWATRNWQS